MADRRPPDTGFLPRSLKDRWRAASREFPVLVYLLPPYHTNVTLRLVKRPKLYLLETGLASYLTDWSTPETLASGALAGAMLETHVVAEVLKSYSEPAPTGRTATGAPRTRPGSRCRAR